jgi:ketosteroid isomerase-like protein
MKTMRSWTLLPFIVLASALTCVAQAGFVMSTGDAASIRQIQALIGNYVRSVDDLDINLARNVWSNASEVTFIHPRGTERGLENVLQNFYRNTMGIFSNRQLLADPAEVHTYGDTAWAQFTWTFHATVKDGNKEITTRGRETQIYHKENGAWHIVHVHYSGMPETGALRGF